MTAHGGCLDMQCSGQEDVITWTPSKDGLEPMVGVR